MKIETTPAQRIVAEVESGHPDAGHLLLEYLMYYGTEGIDVQALATKVVNQPNEDDANNCHHCGEELRDCCYTCPAGPHDEPCDGVQED